MTKKKAVDLVKDNGVFQVVKFDITRAAIKKMADQYKDLEITDTASYKVVTAAIADVRSKRTAVEKRRKELKADALEFGRKVDAEAKDIMALLLEIEEPLKATKQAEDDRKAAIKAEKERKEQERIDGIRAKINELRAWCFDGIAHNKSSRAITLVLSKLQETFGKLTKDDYMEFLGEAQDLLWDAIMKTQEALKSRQVWEAEEEQRKAEEIRLAEIKKQQEEEAARQKAEQDKIEAEKRKIEEEKAKIEAEKKAEAEWKEREEFERKIRAEAKERAEKEAAEKAKREAEEAEAKRLAEEAEKKRLAELAPDKEKLAAYANALQDVPIPKIKDQQLNSLLSEVVQELREVLNRLYLSSL